MFRAAHSSGAISEVDSKMSRVQPVCHASCGIRSAARADTFTSRTPWAKILPRRRTQIRRAAS